MSVITRIVPTGSVDPDKLLVELNVDANTAPSSCVRVAAFVTDGDPDDTLEIEFVGDPLEVDVDAVLAAHPSADPIVSKIREIEPASFEGPLEVESGVPQLVVGWIVPIDSSMTARGSLFVATGVTGGRARSATIAGELTCSRNGSSAPHPADLRYGGPGNAPGVVLSTAIVGNAVLLYLRVNVTGEITFSIDYSAKAIPNPGGAP
jgi:hypothetical protein